ncbi:MAG: 1,4-alpha-glucan branching protein domain-containing protein [Byssovorax sp.]
MSEGSRQSEGAARVGLVLHAHLPWVRHPEHARPLEERWLHEAIAECYLPLVDVLDRLGDEGVACGLTLSISPPLAAMLRDPLLLGRFEQHLDALDRLVDGLRRGVGQGGAPLDADTLAAAGATGPALSFHARRIAWIRGLWARCAGDLLGAFVRHHDAGRIELITTTATHAYLPGLAGSPASIRAQLRIGLRAFHAMTGRRPLGLWLPECAYEPRLGPELSAAGARYTVLDAHGLLLGRPRPPCGVLAPVLSADGVAFFARDPEAARDVWSRKTGYPGDPVYREFYRDVGFDLPAAALGGELGPRGTRLMTGIKLFRITGPGPHKEPYDPALGEARAREHAERFVSKRITALTSVSAGYPSCPAPVLVAPFDAELFGHWWFEGPIFLEHVLRALDRSGREGGPRATTLGGYLAEHPELVRSEPATSTWGEGGFGEVWTGPAAARLIRPTRHAERLVRSAVAARRGATGLAGRALDLAIVELLLLHASDWAFMLHRGEMAEYAEARARRHAERAARLSQIAREGEATVEDLAWVHAVGDEDRFLAQLTGEALRDAFDPWG